jgi:hypothetical protein
MLVWMKTLNMYLGVTANSVTDAVFVKLLKIIREKNNV